MNNSPKYFAMVGFAFYGMWLFYMSLTSFVTQMPKSGFLTLASSLIAIGAAYFTWKQKWRLVVVFFFLLFVVGDLAAVFFSAKQ